MQFSYDVEYTSYVQQSIDNFFQYYKKRFGRKKPIFVCIGTSKVPGDAIGPYVGTILSNLDNSLTVYGTVEFPVHAANVDLFARKLWIKNFFNRPIIAVDACIGNSPLGTIWCLESSGIKPGKACGRDLDYIGNTAIMVTTTDDPAKLTTVDDDMIRRVSAIISSRIYENLLTL